jgi:UDP-GlcNAc:undecaprenyl-phosphate GlcNAc-1-phosphate transferase
MNWLDGVGGQVSVLSTIGFLMIGFLAYFRNFEGDFALLAFVLAAIAGAGILFEFPVPRMLIGDTGSMFFGLMLGVLGIYQGGKVATAFLALGIPLIDALLVILERVSHGRSPFSGGHDHLHHLLIERRGWQDKSVVLLTALLGCSFGGSALFLSTAGKGISLCILALVVMGLRKYARHQQ